MIKQFFDNIFHRGEQKMNDEMRRAVLLNAAAGEATQKSDADVMWQQQLGTNYELLHDDGVEDLLNEAMFKKAVVYNQVTQKWEVIAKAQLDFDMAALRILISPVNRASFLSPKEAEAMKYKIRAILKRIKMQMNPDHYNLGVSNFLKSIEIYTEFALNDAMDGRKAKLTKTIPKISTFQVETVNTNQKQGGKTL
jgi:hypothetical protein